MTVNSFKNTFETKWSTLLRNVLLKSLSIVEKNSITYFKELEKQNIIKQMGFSPDDKPVYGTTYLNRLTIISKTRLY